MKLDEQVQSEIMCSIEHCYSRKARWAITALHLTPLIQAFEVLGEEAKASEHRCEISFYSHLRVEAAGDRMLLAKIFRLLRTSGFATTAERPEANATSWSGYFKKQIGEEKFEIHVSFASTVCRLVQVGTKTTEVPVYETQCGEDKGVPLDDDIPF